MLAIALRNFKINKMKLLLTITLIVICLAGCMQTGPDADLGNMKHITQKLLDVQGGMINLMDHSTEDSTAYYKGMSDAYTEMSNYIAKKYKP